MKRNLKYFLKNKLSDKELKLVPTSFDVIGRILIFSDFPEELAKKEKAVGNAVLENLKHIKTVLKKTKKYSGRFRIPKFKVIAGDKNKEATYKENNVTVKLNVEKLYFSPRLGNERSRIAKLVRKGEKVLVMFSGTGIYALVIAKNSEPESVYGIELNKVAHKYSKENIKINRLENKINPISGDVRKVLPKLKERFDRIVMPLPKGGGHFLNLAFKFVNKNGFIHFYDFLGENEFEKAIGKIRDACKKEKRRFKVVKIVKCGEFASRVFRICVDIKVL